MREIKFKAKRIDTNEWVYGYLVKRWNDISFDEFKHFIEYIIIDNIGDKYAINKETVCQFAERNDIKGKEIYDGNIVEFNGKRGEVWYNSSAGRWYIDNSNGLNLDFKYIGECKIIGNKFDGD